jgi:hypothetical protein
MADEYEKLKVPDLKKLLKDRSIPSTGLTRKAQYIEKLREWDQENASAPARDDGPQDTPVDANDTDATVTADVSQIAESHATLDVLAASTSSSVTLPPDDVQSQEAAVEPPAQPASDPATEPPAIEPTPTSEPLQPDGSAPTQTDAPTANDEAAGTQPGFSAEDSNLTTRVPTEEIMEDNRKRKRRSMTPPVKEDEIALKRQKQEEANDPDVSFTEGTEKESTLSLIKDSDVNVPAAEAGTKQSTSEELSGETTKEDSAASQRKQSTTAKDVRYKSLFQTRSTETAAQPASAPEVDYSKGVEEAMHPVTRALYIRNFMRPMQPITLRKHLASIAEPTWSGGDDADIVHKFHLDQIRTHAFVLFASEEKAILARSALHGRVWPAERDRKQLWADFIPEENVQRWIDMETNDDGGGKTGGRRWEVRYSSNTDGGVETGLVELGSGQNQDRRPSRPAGDEPANQKDIPTGPRSMQQAPRAAPEASALPVAQGPNTDASFEKLGTLFPSTTAKPIIYHQPVSEEIASARMEEFAKETSRDWKEKDWRDDDLYRFSFEDGGKLVHSGRHLMSYRVRTREEQITGVRSSVPAPAPRPGRGGYRGGFRGYRGGGNSYRP